MGQAKRRGSFEERLRQAEKTDGKQYKGAIVVADTGDIARGKLNLADTLNTPKVDGVIMVGTAYHSQTRESMALTSMALTLIISNCDIRKNGAKIEQIWSDTRKTVPMYKDVDWGAEAYIPLDTPEAVVWPKDLTPHRKNGFVTMCLQTGVLDQLVKHKIDLPEKETA